MAQLAEGPDRDVLRIEGDIYNLAAALRAYGEEVARRLGQTQARWAVLGVVTRMPLTVPVIARWLGLTRQAIQRVADDLVDDGLAEYVRNPDHKRSPLLRLTPDGARTFTALAQAARPRRLHTADALGEDGIRQLRELIERMRRSLAEPLGDDDVTVQPLSGRHLAEWDPRTRSLIDG